MIAAKRKSKKPSAAKRLQQLKDSTTFFVDCNLSKRVAIPLRNSGYLVEVHDDHFSQGCQDVEWIQEVAARGWVSITLDNRISIRPNERQAVTDSGMKLFIIRSKNLMIEDYSHLLARVMDRMLHAVDKHEAPFIIRISRFGRLNRLDLR